MVPSAAPLGATKRAPKAAWPSYLLDVKAKPPVSININPLLTPLWLELSLTLSHFINSACRSPHAG